MSNDTPTLEQAVFTVLEGFTLPHDVRKVLEAAYYNRSALSATQPAQAAQGETKRCEHCDDTGDVTSIDGHWRGYCTCQHGKAAQGEKPLFAAKIAARKWAELQEQGARMQSIAFDGGKGGAGTIDPWGVVRWDQAAQGAGEVVAIHPSWLDCWSFNECDRLARIWTAGIDLTKSDDHDNDLGPQWKVVMAIMLARLAHRAAVAPTQPAAGADVLDAGRWRKLEQSGFELIQRRSGKKTLWAARPAFTNYEYELHETAAQAVDAIAASGRQE